MEPKEPTKPNLPSEAIELYNLFIHGVISRRAFMTEVQKFAIGGLTAATIIEALMPQYACGRSVPTHETRCRRNCPALSSCTKIEV